MNHFLKISLLAIATQLTLPGYSQSYIPYYKFCILADIAESNQQMDSAIYYYDQAKAVIPDKSKFAFNIYLASLLQKRKDNTKIRQYLSDQSCIETKKSIREDLDDFDEAKYLIANFDSLYIPTCSLAQDLNFTDKIPFNLDSLITVCIKRDQEVRQGHAGDTVHTLVVDAEDFKALKWYIDRFGFTHLGGQKMAERVTLLMHIDNYDNFRQIQKALLKAIHDGNLHPCNYAYSLDRSLVYSHLKPYYYSWNIDGTPAPADLKKINKRRAKIGLPPYPLWSKRWF